MLAFVEGKLEYIDGNAVVINCGGIGYEIAISAREIEALPPIGMDLRLYTYMNVNENTGVSLFGFLTKDELDMFKLLITVNGVGPRGAQSILSTLDTDTLRFAILSGDAKAISKAPGIGPKAASKVIIDLKDKMDLFDAFEKKLENTKASADDMAGLESAKEEAVLALVSLGYSRTESLQAVRKVQLTDDMTVDMILSASLKYLL